MKKAQIVIEIFGIIVGSFLIAISTNTLLLPSPLLAGGVTGICMIFYHLFGWSVAVQYFIYNIPLLVLGYMYIGKKFIFYTILSVVFSSLFLDLIPIHYMWTENVILASIFGAVMMGIGASLTLRLGGSGGGLDVLSRVIAKYRNISIAKCGLMMNVIIVTISTVLFDVQSAMFTILSLYAGAKTYEMFLGHAERSSVIIITDKGQEVADAVNKAMHRGVTSWDATGAYSHSEKTVLLCVIVNIQWSELCHVVAKIDPKAFISAMPTQKTVGNFTTSW